MRSAFALRMIQGKIIYKFGIPERLRTLRDSIFTGGDVEENGIYSACFQAELLQFMEYAQVFSFCGLTA